VEEFVALEAVEDDPFEDFGGERTGHLGEGEEKEGKGGREEVGVGGFARFELTFHFSALDGRHAPFLIHRSRRQRLFQSLWISTSYLRTCESRISQGMRRERAFSSIQRRTNRKRLDLSCYTAFEAT